MQRSIPGYTVPKIMAFEEEGIVVIAPEGVVVRKIALTNYSAEALATMSNIANSPFGKYFRITAFLEFTKTDPEINLESVFVYARFTPAEYSAINYKSTVHKNPEVAFWDDKTMVWNPCKIIHTVCDIDLHPEFGGFVVFNPPDWGDPACSLGG
jgi:hypothetical protein